MAMWQFGIDVDMRPLPSFSTKHSVPLLAAAKLTPETPISAFLNFSLRTFRPMPINWSTSFASASSPNCRLNSSAIWSWFLWSAGMIMCDGFSFASWTINSPISDSVLSIPWSSKWWFSSISSLAIDLPLMTFVALFCCAIWRKVSLASFASNAQCTLMPFRVQLCSSCSNSVGNCCGRAWRTRVASSWWCSHCAVLLMDSDRLLCKKSIAPRRFSLSSWSSKASTMRWSKSVMIGPHQTVVWQSWQYADAEMGAYVFGHIRSS